MADDSYNLKLTRVPKIIILIGGVYLEESTNSKAFQQFFKLYSMLLLGLIYVVTIFHFFVAVPEIIKNGDIQMLAMGVSNGFSILKTAYKVTIYLSPKMTKILFKCYSKQQQLYGLNHYQEVKTEYDKNSEFFKKTIGVVFIIGLVGAVFFEFLMVFLYFQKLLGSNNSLEVMPEMFPFTIYSGLGLLYKTVAIYAAGVYNVVAFFYYLTPVMYVSVQLKALQMLTRNLRTDRAATREIKNIIIWHQDISRFVEELNDIISFPLLVEYLVMALTLASLMVVNLMPDTTFYFLCYSANFFFLHTIQLFLMSWQANEIYYQSSAISDSLAESTWYEQSKEVKQIIQIMMIRTQRPLTINVGIFFPMTLNSAVATMKTAYSCATMALALQ